MPCAFLEVAVDCVVVEDVACQDSLLLSAVSRNKRRHVPNCLRIVSRIVSRMVARIVSRTFPFSEGADSGVRQFSPFSFSWIFFGAKIVSPAR